MKSVLTLKFLGLLHNYYNAKNNKSKGRKGATMKSRSSLIIIIILILFSTGCSKNNLNISKKVTEIEVVNWDTEEFVASIKDEEFIKELIDKLNNAETESTANADMPMPDYKLYFKHNDEVIYEIGYYKNNSFAQYWDGEQYFEVFLLLPFD